MRLSSALRPVFLIVVLIGAAYVSAQSKDATVNEVKGMPPRVAPTEYQAHVAAGPLTIAADFEGHSVATPEATYTTEEYVVVEVGMFGAPGARALLSKADFSLRINGKKTAAPSQPYELVFKSLKDPEWELAIAPLLLRSTCRSSCGAQWNSASKGPLCSKATAPFLRPDCFSLSIEARLRASVRWS
jgi:hypothetical protein